MLALLLLTAAAPDPRVLRGELQTQNLAQQDARAEAERLRREIGQLNAKLTELNAIAAAGEKGVQGRRAQLDALNARETALSQEMARSRAELARLLAALQLYRRQPPPALLVTPGSAKDAVRAAILIRAVEPELRQRAAVLKARAEELTRLRRAILSVSEDLITAESTLAEDRGQLERQLKEKAALERQLQADVADYQRRASVLAGQLRAIGAPTSGPTLRPRVQPPSVLLTPAQGSLLRRFGQRASDGEITNGLIWRTRPGAQVRAPATGLVRFAGPRKPLGGVVILDVGGGYLLTLTGLDRITVQPGKSLPAGQSLGAMAQAGAPELYLELRRDGAPIDPTRLLR